MELKCLSEHYLQLRGHTEREIQVASAEMRKSQQNHGRGATITAKRLADFLASVESHEAVLTQRQHDLETRDVLVRMGGYRMLPGEQDQALFDDTPSSPPLPVHDKSTDGVLEPPEPTQDDEEEDDRGGEPSQARHLPWRGHGRGRDRRDSVGRRPPRIALAFEPLEVGAQFGRRLTPQRSILFMCTTAEEAGLLGAKWNAEHPFYPLEKTLADINIDSMNVWGKARDIEDVSYGFSTMDDALAAAAQRQGRKAIPNSRPEKGAIYRADNLEFSKAGVPSLYIGKGEHLVSRPPNGPLRSDEFDLKDYHQVTDEVHADWDLSGAVQDVDLLFEVGYQIANADKFPEWKPGIEFKPKRDAMLKK